MLARDCVARCVVVEVFVARISGYLTMSIKPSKSWENGKKAALMDRVIQVGRKSTGDKSAGEEVTEWMGRGAPVHRSF